jgi:hypothetical protein
VFWHNYTDSLEVDMSAIPAGNKLVSVFISNLKVGSYTFYVKTYDAKGNVSVPANATAIVFDSDYGLSMNPQPIISSSMNDLGQWFIQLGALDDVLNSEIEYQATDASTKTIIVSASDELTEIDDVMSGSSFRYRSLYFGIDSIYTAYYDGKLPSLGAYPNGVPHGPGIVEAAYFNLGGEGVGYHDNDNINDGGAFRNDEGVDIHWGNPYRIWPGWQEWMKYTINVPVAGIYHFAFYAGCGGNSDMTFEITGQSSIPVVLPGSGYATQRTDGPDVSLPAGRHVVTLYFPNGQFYFDKFEFLKQ